MAKPTARRPHSPQPNTPRPVRESSRVPVSPRGAARGGRGGAGVGTEVDADSAPERWLANIRISGFTFIVLVLLVLGVIVLAPSLKLLIEQQQQISGLQNSVTDQNNEVDKLKDQVARWDDPAYIVAQARNRLLFVYPGEYSYLVVDKGEKSTTTDGAPISPQIQDTKVDWLQSLTSSLLTAGLSKAPASKLDSPLPTPRSAPQSLPSSFTRDQAGQ
jgi:cell division protein FtsB